MDAKSLLTHIKTMDKSTRRVVCILFFFTGLINNLGVVILLTGSQCLSQEFEQNNNMGLYQM